MTPTPSLANYIDYEAFADTPSNSDYTMGVNGHVSRRIGPSASRPSPKERLLLIDEKRAAKAALSNRLLSVSKIVAYALEVFR